MTICILFAYPVPEGYSPVHLINHFILGAQYKVRNTEHIQYIFIDFNE